MKNILLGIIAINLTFISANLYLRSVEPVQAHYDKTFQTIMNTTEVELAIKNALSNCRLSGDWDDSGNMSGRFRR